MIVEFFVPGKPQGKARARVIMRGSFVHTYTPDQTVSYENLIKLCFKEANKTFYTNGAVSLSVTAMYPVPKSYSHKKRGQALEGKIKPQTKPDADNIIKVVCDALNGIAYADDKSITELSARKLYAEQPGLKISITAIEEER